MSIVKVDQIEPRSASGEVTLGVSGDTFKVPDGVTLANEGTLTGFGTNILQVKHYSFPEIGSETTQAAWSNTNTTGTITCANVDSDVLVMFGGSCISYRNSSSVQYSGMYRLKESVTGDEYPDTDYFSRGGINKQDSTTGNFFGTHVGGTWLHSPNSTSELTYSVQIYNPFVKVIWNGTADETATLTLMEIGA